VELGLNQLNLRLAPRFFGGGGLGGGGETFYLLQEDGTSRFQLEDGSGFILLESAP
jgi:hypothetical protein